MRKPLWMKAAWRYCWICALPGGGHGGPVYWFQAWHLGRIKRKIDA